MDWKTYTLGAGAIAVAWVAVAVLVWSVMAEQQKPMKVESLRTDLARQGGR